MPGCYHPPMFTLAHLSDPHIGPLPRPRLAELAGKRLLGFASWQLHRRARHRLEVLNAITEDVEAAAPDHVAVTGDLINIALEHEYGAARVWLNRLGPPDRVTLVPGNHDAYVRATAHHAARFWDPYMRGDPDATDGATGFPFLRRRGPIALIALSSAVPTAPFMATGRIGTRQLAQFAAILEELKDEAVFRVVLVHHPPAGVRARHKRLVDAAALVQVLAQHGADLVLHGHDHVHSLQWLEGLRGRIAMVGVPSSSASSDGRDDPAGYNLYRIERTAGSWSCEAVTRGGQPGHDGIAELKRQMLIG
jgi:3',5'-cyclic AMP phosphodiesterase CpdA